jgi:proliferating cell nuclear antigen
MRLTIDNKSKQEVFVAIFQLLKHWASHINMHFEKDKLFIQTMDKSHVCLADFNIKNNWFSNYECLNNIKLSLDANHFAILLNAALKHDIIELRVENESEPDKLYINFLNNTEKKGEFEHFFELNLLDIEEDTLDIPKVDYDVDFTIETKKWIDVLSELNTIGEDLNIHCKQNIIELIAIGDASKLTVNIPVDELNEYAIAEDEEVNISFSLKHLCKKCCSTKLCTTLDISLSKMYPMALKYNLGDESQVIFYIAPKISD